jgi:hypothetical protein
MAEIAEIITAEDIAGILSDLEDTIQAMVDQQVDERHITPLRCRLLEGRNLDSAYGVTQADWADYVQRCGGAANHLEEQILAAKQKRAAELMALSDGLNRVIFGAEDHPALPPAIAAPGQGAA